MSEDILKNKNCQTVLKVMENQGFDEDLSVKELSEKTGLGYSTLTSVLGRLKKIKAVFSLDQKKVTYYYLRKK